MRSLTLLLLIEQLFSAFAATANSDQELKDYIVGFHPITSEKRSAHHDWVKRDLLSHLSHDEKRGVSREYHISDEVSGYFGRFTKREIDDLKKSGDVSHVEEDVPVPITPYYTEKIHQKRDEIPNSANAGISDECNGNICKRKNAPWHLARVSHKENTVGSGKTIDPSYEYIYEKDKKNNVTIFHMDSGLDNKHLEFEGRNIRIGFDIERKGDFTDKHGHGTTLASVIVGKTLGIFPEAELVMLRGVRENATLPQFSNVDVIQCLEWIAQNRLDTPSSRSIILLPLQADKLVSQTLDALKVLIEAGLGVVFAAGNDNKDLSKISKLIIHDNVLYAASSNSQDNKAISNYGEWVNIFAPGELVIAVDPNTINGYSATSGTSISVAQVAAAAAMVWSKYPDKPFAEIASLLKNGNRDVLKGDLSGSQNALLYTLSK